MDLEKLKNRDYVLIIDKSGSMSEKDTASGKSRWEYAQESTLAIARKVAEYDPDGITVIPFAASHKIYDNTTPEKVKDVFTENSPMGGTLLAPVLKDVFNDYLSRKGKNQTKLNGQLVLVITDGQPEDENEVAAAIVKFGNQLPSRDEFGISFLQVGRDTHAAQFLAKLDSGLKALGAKNDIVNTKTMDEVEKIGLTEALVAALTD